MQMKTRIDVAVVPMLKTEMNARLVGETVKTMGMKNDDQVKALMQAATETAICAVFVVGRHPDGRRETLELIVPPPKVGATIELPKDDTKSTLEHVDPALALSVVAQAKKLERMGLRPEFYVDFAPRVKKNPALMADVMNRLNLRTLPPEPEPERVTAPVAYQPYTLPPSPPTADRYPQTVQAFTGWEPPPGGWQTVTVAEVRPAKDPDVLLRITSTRRG